MIYIDPTPLTDEEMAAKYGDGLTAGSMLFLGNKSEKAIDYGVLVGATVLAAMLPESGVPPISLI